MCKMNDSSIKCLFLSKCGKKIYFDVYFLNSMRMGRKFYQDEEQSDEHVSSRKYFLFSNQAWWV